MAEEKKTFVLYEYLLYFWKKKWFFVIVPLITAILVAAAVYVLKDNHKYVGQAVVAVGASDSQKLLDPDFIQAQYDEIKGLDVFVSEKGKVKIKVFGDSKDRVQKDLDQILEAYTSDLEKDYQTRIDLSQTYLDQLNARVQSLEESIAFYEKKVEGGNLAPDEATETQALLIRYQDQLTTSAERAYKISGDIALAATPEVVGVSVAPGKTYLPESIAIGIVLGLVVTVALLMLLKYLFDARRYYRS